MLKVSDIHKVYRDAGKELPVLKGVSLEVQQKDIVCIVGPSGAGKSTLLHIMGGLDEPTKGKVEFLGSNLSNFTEDDLAELRNEKIGFIFQFYHLLGEFSVLENVTLPALIGSKSSNVNKKAILERAAALLEMVGMSKRLNHLPGQLSGGEMQRVAIARALINNPRLLLCDEPTGNLDSENGLKICSILKDLNNKNNTTIIIVTHDESVARLATKVIHIKDGLILN